MSPPTRFSSMRASSRPAAVLPPVSRDDSSLAAFRSFRYEKTVAAEPPVQYKPTIKRASTMLPPREPSLKRSPSSSTTTSSSANSCTASVSAVSLAGTAATSIHGGSVVVVAAPSMRLILPSVPPPTELHPALRSPAPLLDERKRDSGHGSAIMKDTIHEEERLNVVGLSEHDDCFVESRQRWRQQPTTSKHAAATSSPATPPASSVSAGPVTFGSGKPRRQSLFPANEVRPRPATACLTTSGTYYGAGAPSKNSSACATGAAPTNGSPATITAAARAPKTSPSSIIAPLDLHITSTASSSSSSSSRNKLPPPTVSAAITASDFIPAPLSQPPSPSRSSSRASSRPKLFRRQSLHISSLWGGSRDDSATTRPSSNNNTQPHSQHNTTPRALRRCHSGSQLRGTSTDAVGNTRLAADITIPGSAARRRPATGAAATPAAPASAKLQPLVKPPLSPARSSSRSSSQAMSSPSPDLDRESAAADFSPLVVAIDTESLLDDSYITSMHFSKRGSYIDPDNILAMGRMSITDDDRSATPTQHSSVATVPRPASSATSYAAADGQARAPRRAASPAPDMPGIMTPDLEQESQKVRQLYASGSPPASLRDTSRHSYCDRLEPTPEVLTEDDDSAANGNTLAPSFSVPNSVNSSSNDATARREPTDPAGGFEDWDDLDSNMVDRYGFIGTPRSQSRVGTPTEMRSQHRSPRRRNVLIKRDPMGFASSQGRVRLPSRKVSARSLNTQHSEVSLVSFRSSRSVLRQAGNLLPQNRNRRWMDEAGDMLTVSPNLQDSVEEAQVEKISEALKRKEIERSEKWRRMARVIRNGDQGQGMEFDFDTRNPKLIERTWKGIPDRWRAAAWWSFLATSAREYAESATDDEITADFHRLQDCASADDTQIDLDVPRTISRHVMFRRRYRGGQRLLFRVLHALSLYFPETGYVQGMASLAATLLCYFDEEKCFVMLVRMWRLRGLERLYRPPGFQGLMAALHEFETRWLHRDVAAKMADLGIDGTAYGTRWYLTLFNLSIPFAAQLRVWDVFLLLGDPARGELHPPQSDTSRLTPKPSANSLVSLPSIQEKPATPPLTSTCEAAATTKPSSGLDVLHATSAALIQALREVLLDADFENAMKALTAWIPIKDEDLLMKVTRAEWKTQLKKRS
ncbi:Rab-GAP/TBC domain protein [Cordyceps fumosorosea ARSEF 2679]|uniref:Rab-GAP/TBC domain protein n=1 Tax=Cordyceps fumosorosea (strain ARSEF 2679) TaxID=1081104 RepID=A0A167R1B1_CORFA|nr:Rab-GAP/TBC domain protein [Cordyceps fumosorosea ARSEF 2679]OAA58176.1 Rab-GAP/TBC domain protein [Cordyceps fumosorosea ARSEF 2679]